MPAASRIAATLPTGPSPSARASSAPGTCPARSGSWTCRPRRSPPLSQHHLPRSLRSCEVRAGCPAWREARDGLGSLAAEGMPRSRSPRRGAGCAAVGATWPAARRRSRLAPGRAGHSCPAVPSPALRVARCSRSRARAIAVVTASIRHRVGIAGVACGRRRVRHRPGARVPVPRDRRPRVCRDLGPRVRAADRCCRPGDLMFTRSSIPSQEMP